MHAYKYIVIGRYDCDRNTTRMDGGRIDHLISSHRSLRCATRAADRAHYDLHGCTGSQPLAQVMRRLAPGEAAAEEADLYAHAGHQYLGLHWWDTHRIAPAAGGLGLVVR